MKTQSRRNFIKLAVGGVVGASILSTHSSRVEAGDVPPFRITNATAMKNKLVREQLGKSEVLVNILNRKNSPLVVEHVFSAQGKKEMTIIPPRKTYLEVVPLGEKVTIYENRKGTKVKVFDFKTGERKEQARRVVLTPDNQLTRGFHIREDFIGEKN